MRRALLLAMAGLLVCATSASAAPPTVFNPLVEAQNFSKTQERQTIYDTPAYQAQLTAVSVANGANAVAAAAADPARQFMSDVCWNGGNGCAGDVRLYDWGTAGYGIVRPVLFTARNGATLSGHVWATVAGPARVIHTRPDSVAPLRAVKSTFCEIP